MFEKLSTIYSERVQRILQSYLKLSRVNLSRNCERIKVFRLNLRTHTVSTSLKSFVGSTLSFTIHRTKSCRDQLKLVAFQIQFNKQQSQIVYLQMYAKYVLSVHGVQIESDALKTIHCTFIYIFASGTIKNLQQVLTKKTVFIAQLFKLDVYLDMS